MLEPIAIYFEHCEPNWQVPQSVIHNHILLLVTSGSITYTIDGQPLFLRKGDALFAPRGAIRSAENSGLESPEIYVAHFRSEPGETVLPLLQERRPLHLHIQPFHYDYFKQRFSRLTQSWLRKTAYSSIVCHSVLLEMLAIINEEAASRYLPGKPYSIVMQLQDYIVNHYRNPISITELAAFVDRTPNYVSTVFKQITGQTITAYTQQIRISAARDLLINSQMTVGEIADYLGFCEQSYFNKVFKKITGMPPSACMKEKTKVWQ